MSSPAPSDPSSDAAPAAGSLDSAPLIDSPPPNTLAPLLQNETLVYIANISFTVTDEQLKQAIVQQANVVDIETMIVTRKGRVPNGERRSRGIGFAKVPTSQLASVLNLNGVELYGRPMEVQVAKVQLVGGDRVARANKSTPAGAISASQTMNEVKESAEEDQQPMSVRGNTLPTLKSKKNDTIEADDHHSLLYINNLPFSTTSDDILSLLNTVLEPSDELPIVELILSKFGSFKGRSRGFGFVCVRKEQEDMVLSLKGTIIQGREFGITRAQGRSKTETKGGKNEPTESPPEVASSSTITDGDKEVNVERAEDASATPQTESVIDETSDGTDAPAAAASA